jgi:hypothetical protein
MIAANSQITIAAVWERVIGEHGTTVAYQRFAPTSAATAARA